MSTATLNLSIVAKRMLSKAEAAHYCGMAVKRFEIDCPVLPVRFPNGDYRWDTRDLDQWIDSLKQGSEQTETVDSILARLC
jgi:hypothetical protein